MPAKSIAKIVKYTLPWKSQQGAQRYTENNNNCGSYKNAEQDLLSLSGY